MEIAPEDGDEFVFPGVDKMGISVTKKTEKSCHPLKTLVFRSGLI